MRIDSVPGVTFVKGEFLSSTLNVWASLPFGRSAPDYNERAHNFYQLLAKLAFAEGYERVTVHLT